ncbi:uncharacterized protein LOC143808488 [Ranitomeya variabilis]|uniref:uncharacterized protein LOC143808488 n=1 Tax=Ranitomeya variabilis TaxID=490064 RepID=UPI00405785AF
MAQMDLNFGLPCEVQSTVNSSDVALMSSKHSSQLQTCDSLQNAVQAINEFEECTTSNYIVIEKHKNFGNEALFSPCSTPLPPRPNQQSSVKSNCIHVHLNGINEIYNFSTTREALIDKETTHH